MRGGGGGGEVREGAQTREGDCRGGGTFERGVKNEGERERGGVVEG